MLDVLCPIKSSPCNVGVACIEMDEFNNGQNWKKICEVNKLCGALGGLQGIYILDALRFK